MTEPPSSVVVRDAQGNDAPAAGGDPPLRVQLLGGFHVTVGGHVVPDAAWRTQKARSLVKLLCLAPGHQLHREQVMEFLWPALEPAAAAGNLRFALHAARRALAPGHAAGIPSFLHLRRNMLVLEAANAVWIDVDAFQAAVAAARVARTRRPTRRRSSATPVTVTRGSL